MNLLKLKDFTQEIDKLVDILNRKFCIIPKLGIELEFYLRDRNNKLVTAAEIKRFKEKLEESNIILTEEKGADQFETQINHTSNILKLLSKINTTKSCLVLVAEKLNLKVLFNPKPFKNDYGSSMHFHLSLHDQKERNIFSEESINTNELLNSVISAILLMLNPSLYFFCEDMLEEYDRFTPNFMAPVNVSWGGNNRTTAIRIPESNIYIIDVLNSESLLHYVTLKRLYFINSMSRSDSSIFGEFTL